MKSAGAKCLIQVGQGETILSRLVRQFRWRWPNSPIFVCVGFEEKKVRAKAPRGLRFVSCPDHATTNVSESVRLGLEAAPPGPVLVCFGDLVLGEGAIQSLDLTPKSILWGESGLSRVKEVGLTVSESGTVGHLCHELPVRWAQLALLQQDAREMVGRVFREGRGVDKWLLYETINGMIARGVEFSFQRLADWVVELDFSRDIAAAKLAIRLERGEGECGF